MRKTTLIATLFGIVVAAAGQTASANPHYHHPMMAPMPVYHPPVHHGAIMHPPMHHMVTPVHHAVPNVHIANAAIPHHIPAHVQSAAAHVPAKGNVPALANHQHPKTDVLVITPHHSPDAHRPHADERREIERTAQRDLLKLLKENKHTTQTAMGYIPVTNRSTSSTSISTSTSTTFVSTNANVYPAVGSQGFASPALGYSGVLPVSGVGPIQQTNTAEWGLRIVKVFPGFAAARADLRVGDLIVSAAGKRVQSPEELTDALAAVANPTDLVFFNNETKRLEKTTLTPAQGKIGVNTERAPIPAD